MAEPRVAARIKRQERLTDANPLRLHAVIAEAALRLEVGGRAVISAQIEKLRDASVADNITIQVLPAATWRKSSFSVADGNCVEVAPTGDGRLAVRDSKVPDQGAILLTSAEMTTWIKSLQG